MQNLSSDLIKLRSSDNICITSPMMTALEDLLLDESALFLCFIESRRKTRNATKLSIVPTLTLSMSVFYCASRDDF